MARMQQDPDSDDAGMSQSVHIGGDQVDIMANAPWWLISAGLHVVLMLVATLVYIEKFHTIDEGEVIITVHPAPSAVIQELERPKDVVERKGIPKDEVQQATEEPAIFFPEAKESDHNESADGEDFHQMKGQSTEYLGSTWGEGGGIRGRQSGKGPGVYDSMGVGGGGGGGGRYGGRFGGKENLVARGGGTRASESAVLCALKWLARHQSPDGCWKAASFVDQCTGSKCGHPGANDYDAGETGLALLAFLGAGYTHLSREEVKDNVTGKTIKLGEVVKKAIRWLVNNQDADGCIGPKVSKMLYNHSICTLALSEAYGMTESQILKDPAQKAIDFLVAAKNPYKAWRYSPKCGENDSSVTGWCVMALKSAELSNLNVGHSTQVEAKAWIAEITDQNYGKCGYQSLEDAGVKVVVPGKNEDYTQHEALSAVGMVVRTFVDHDRKDPILEMSAKLLSGDLPVWDQAKKTNDYYYWYYGTLALFQYDGPDSGGGQRYWKTWNQAVINALVKNQKTKDAGCADGSWDADDRWGFEGGRVYAVAINALTMEVYYRYANAFGVGGKKPAAGKDPAKDNKDDKKEEK